MTHVYHMSSYLISSCDVERLECTKLLVCTKLIMNSVYFPAAQVVLFLRRIVNVISTLSITNQYLLLKQANVDEQWATIRGTDSSSSPNHAPRIELSDVDLQWPWWAYKRDLDWLRLVLWENRPVKRCRESTTRGNYACL